MGVCDEWGGAESRGNGARPVEWMIMNDTCATHRSRVPRRSFGRNKRRSDDIGRRERTRPGFYFMFCVRQSSARGCRFSVMFGYFFIKMFKCSPVPASFFPYIRTALQCVNILIVHNDLKINCYYRYNKYFSITVNTINLNHGASWDCSFFHLLKEKVIV